jgi:hypothetical protein
MTQDEVLAAAPPGDWTPLPLAWATLVPAWSPVDLPARLATPSADAPWTYAAVAGPLDLAAGTGWAIRLLVSKVSGTLALSLADGEGQNGVRFMTLPAQDEAYWVAAPLFIPKQQDGHTLILHGLAAGGGAATIHALEVRRLDALSFASWLAAWGAMGRPEPAEPEQV